MLPTYFQELSGVESGKCYETFTEKAVLLVPFAQYLSVGNVALARFVQSQNRVLEEIMRRVQLENVVHRQTVRHADRQTNQQTD